MFTPGKVLRMFSTPGCAPFIVLIICGEIEVTPSTDCLVFVLITTVAICSTSISITGLYSISCPFFKLNFCSTNLCETCVKITVTSTL